jgi:hypothetical protein
MKRLMDMTRGEMDAAVERHHDRRLDRFEREQDMDGDGPDPSDRDVDPGRVQQTWADLELLADCLEDVSPWHGQNADGDGAA